MMAKTFLITSAILGLLAVAVGAFGAHALRSTLEANQRVDTFELASRYQFYHALAIGLIGLLLIHSPRQIWYEYAGYGFTLGIVIFSGSLYLLALSNVRWLGAITPIGGFALIFGWASMLIGILKSDF